MSRTNCGALISLLWVLSCSSPNAAQQPEQAGASSLGGNSGSLGGGGAIGGSGASGGSNGSNGCPTVVQPCTAPSVLASQQVLPGTLRLHAGYLYWRLIGATSGSGTTVFPAGSIVRTAVNAAAPEVLYTSPDNQLTAIDVNNEFVYFNTGTSFGTIPFAGGAAVMQTTVGSNFYQVGVDDDTIYLSVYGSNGGVHQLRKGDASDVFINSPNAGILALDASNVYWASANSSVARAPKLATAGQILANTGLSIVSIRPLGAYVYVLGDTPDKTAQLVRVPVQGGTVEILATYASTSGSITADADYLYFTLCGPTEGVIYRLPVAGGSPVPIVQAGRCLAGIVVDDTNVYFADWGAPPSAGTLAQPVASILRSSKCGCQ